MQSDAELLVLAAQENEHLYLARALEANKGMLVDRVKLTRISGLDYEELMSEMKLRAIKAIRKYNPTKGSWSPYLYMCLKHHMGSLIKQRQTKMRYKMDNTLEYVHDKHTQSYEELHWSDDWPIEGLTVKESVTLELRYLHKYTLKHTGHVTGRAPTTMQFWMEHALDRARTIMARATPRAII